MLDFEYAKALAEVVLDTTCSEKEREVRLECSTQIFGRANAYLKKGFLPDVVEAFFVRKMKGLPLVSTKQDMQDFLKVSTPHYFGGKFTVSNIPYYSEEEELLLWSETSLRGPLITAGYERYVRIILECLQEAYQMEGDMVRSGKNIHATMIYPFVRMLQEKCRDLTEEQIHKTLWKEYEISGADRMFVERASKILEPYEGESEDEK